MADVEADCTPSLAVKVMLYSPMGQFVKANCSVYNGGQAHALFTDGPFREGQLQYS